MRKCMAIILNGRRLVQAIVQKTEKRESLYLLPILHFEALTLPDPEDGQRQKPHAYMQLCSPPGFSQIREDTCKMHIHVRLSLLGLDRVKKLSDFEMPRTSAL